jgi:hypothetical protein
MNFRPIIDSLRQLCFDGWHSQNPANRKTKRVLFVLSGAGVIAGAVVAGLENQNHDACNSDLGQFAQALSSQAVQFCQSVNTLWRLGIAIAVVSVSFSIILLVVERRYGPAQDHHIGSFGSEPPERGAASD